MAWKNKQELLEQEHKQSTYIKFVKEILDPILNEGFNKIGLYDIHIETVMGAKQIVQSWNCTTNYYKCFNELGVSYYEDFEDYYHIIVYGDGHIYLSPQTTEIVPTYILIAKEEIEAKLNTYTENLYNELNRLNIEFKEENF